VADAALRGNVACSYSVSAVSCVVGMGGYGPGEFGAVEPVLRLGEHHPGVDVPVALPVSHDPLSRLERHRRSGAEGLRAGRVPGVAVEQVGLDERPADVLGGGGGEQWPNP